MATIRVTPENNTVIEIMKKTGYFNQEGDIAKFAFAYAMKNRLDEQFPDYQTKSATTKWGFEDLDKDGLLYSIIAAKYPDANVESKVQDIINLGLSKIGEKIAGSTDISISSLIE